VSVLRNALYHREGVLAKVVHSSSAGIGPSAAAFRPIAMTAAISFSNRARIRTTTGDPASVRHVGAQQVRLTRDGGLSGSTVLAGQLGQDLVAVEFVAVEHAAAATPPQPVHDPVSSATFRTDRTADRRTAQ